MTEINSIIEIFKRLTAEELPKPSLHISCAELYELDVLKDAYEVIEKLKYFSGRLPFHIEENSWPGEDKWNSGGQIADFQDGKLRLTYVDSGRAPGRTMRYSNSVEFAYAVCKQIFPRYTASASRAIKTFELEKIKHQRLILWFEMSSNVYHMSCVNDYFSHRSLVNGVRWMRDELVRMELLDKTEYLFSEKAPSALQRKYLIHGLLLSGMPKPVAKNMLSKIELVSHAH